MEVSVAYFGSIVGGQWFPVQENQGLMCQLHLDIGSNWETDENLME